MTVRMLASDLDGTLLNEESNISPETATSIRKAQNAGMRFVVVTGRSWSQVNNMFRKAGLSVDYILLNGAEFRTSAGEIIYQEPMEKKAAKKVIEVLLSNGLDVEIITDRGAFSTNTTFSWKAEEFSEFVKIRDADIRILKIFAFLEDPQYVERCRKKMGLLFDAAVTSSADWNIEITARDAQKGHMLKRVADFYQISRDETVVFGDGYNDETMFCEFTHSRAMENSVWTLYELAEKVIGSNSRDGVAEEINLMIERGREL